MVLEQFMGQLHITPSCFVKVRAVDRRDLHLLV